MSERFNLAADDWDKGDMRQNIAHSVFQMINSRIALKKNMQIMDFGAGTGLLSFRIAPLVNEVLAVDLAEKMLENLEYKNNDKVSVKTLCYDICKNSINEKFDGIISSMAMHHVEDTADLFRAFHVHLKRDGFIAIADLEAEDGTFHSHGNDGVFHFGFERDKLRQTIENAGFEHVRFHHAFTVTKENREYPIFVVIATKKS